MAEHDISLVTAKSSNTVIESMKVALATASAAITPATLTAMVGIKDGSALALPTSVTGAMSSLGAITGNILHPLYGAASAALTNLSLIHI